MHVSTAGVTALVVACPTCRVVLAQQASCWLLLRRCPCSTQVHSLCVRLLLQHKLQGFDLWRTSFSVLKGSLISAAQLLGSWAAEAATLSSDWAMGLDADGHLWQGATFTDPYLTSFQERIEQVGSPSE